MEYLKLLKEFKTLIPKSGNRTLRVAILGSCSTQHITRLLHVLADKRKLTLELYEAPFDSLVAEALDDKSDLYQFRPEYVVVLNQFEAIKSQLLAQENTHFVKDWLGKQEQLLAKLIHQTNAVVIQTNFIAPPERVFGNYENRIDNSMGMAFRDLNHGLLEISKSLNNVHLLDLDFLASEIGRRSWRDEKLWLTGKLPCSFEYLPAYANAILDIISASLGKVIKCVIVDLDNTLWGGVIGDDGLSGIRLSEDGDGNAFIQLQEFLSALKNRGILLAVCSKNELANAQLPFEEHPHMKLKKDDFAVFIANWEDKASNIQAIQKTLNIGLDSMVFLDDNPFERNLVKGLLPEVQVPELPEDPALYLRAISELNLFEITSFSETDLNRSELYRIEAQRNDLKAQFENLDDYLDSLQMTADIERFNDFNLARIVQLMLRSNQFNLKTNRYSESDCISFMNDMDCAPFTISLCDRYGSHGLICVSVVKIQNSDAIIDEFLMSCRVLKRGVEELALNHIFDFARSKNIKRVIGLYEPTDKNSMVKDFYQKYGFHLLDTQDNATERWVLEVSHFQALPNHITTVKPS